MRTEIWMLVGVLSVTTQVSWQLQCYECNDNFKTTWEPLDCQINATAVPSRICNSEQMFCFVQRVTVKGILTRITRDCTSDCRNGCEATSFGITQITCTSCCDQDNCNTGNSGYSIEDGGLVTKIRLLFIHCCSVVMLVWMIS